VTWRDAVKAIPGAPRAIRTVRDWQQEESRPVGGSSDGLRLTVPRKYAHRYFNAPYEPMSVNWLREHIHAGMTAVDVGAHIGFLTCFMARAVGPSGRVVAVEPDQKNARYVRRNLRVNGLTADLYVAGAGNYSGPRDLHITGSSDSHGFYDHPNTETLRVVTVEQKRLDDILDRADVLKVDTEGAECEVIEGAERILSARPPLLIEWTPACQVRAGRDVEELPTMLRDLGYRLTVLDDAANRSYSMDEALADVRSGSLPISWYVNLSATVT
jgi:FkbM family methyltransferase